MPLFNKVKGRVKTERSKDMPLTMESLLFRSGRLTPWQPEYPVTQMVNGYSDALGRRFSTVLKSFSVPEKPLTEVATLIGMEIEVENCGAVDTAPLLSGLWQIKLDGSLRNYGRELVSCALSPGDFPEALRAALAWLFCFNKPEFSFRTSIHVHLDCYNLEVSEFQRLLLLYVLFENSLFQYANPGRRDTNIFCTPITKADLYALKAFLNKEISSRPTELREALRILTSSIQKYSALNLLHLYDFGTIEFRHLRGTGDFSVLLTWVNLLLRLFRAAKTIKLEEIEQAILKLNTTSAYSEFIEKVFGEDLKEELSCPLTGLLLSQGVSLAKELIYASELKAPTDKSTGLNRFISLNKKQRCGHLQRKFSVFVSSVA